METLIVVVVAIALVAIAIYAGSRTPSKLGTSRPSTSKSSPSDRPFRLDEQIGDGEFSGRIEAVSNNGLYGAGYIVHEESSGQYDDFRTKLAIVELRSREWLGETNGPRSFYPDLGGEDFPTVALVLNSGTVVTARLDERTQLKAFDVYGDRLWTKTLPYDDAPDQLELSPTEGRLLAEWLGVGYIVLDMETGKKTMGKKWTESESCLDIEFTATGKVVAYNADMGGTGSNRREVELDETGKPVRGAIKASEFQESSYEPGTSTQALTTTGFKLLLGRIKDALATKPPDYEKAAKLLEAMDRRTTDLPDKYQAQILRFHGEVFVGQNQPIEAIAAWENAIKLNPSVGVTGKLRRLKRDHEAA